MKTYKLIFFYYYKCYTGSSLQIRITMSVKPNLDTLMRMIEENQHKMTEGEYLESMNALCALYRFATSAPPTSPAHVLPHVNDGYSPHAQSSPPYSSIWDE